MKTEVCHNAHYSKSHQALVILREAGIKPEIVKYLDTPLTRDELRSLIEATGLSVTDAVRTKEAKLKELGLPKEPNDEELLNAMVSHPRLIERPFVATDKDVRMVCSTEVIEEIL